MAKRKKDPVQKEVERLRAVYKDLPANQLVVVDGLIIQAARLRVSLDTLQEEINQEGLTQWFTQSPEKTPPYKRITPASDLFVKMDKSYQSIIKQLNELTPPDKSISALDAFKEAEEE